MSFISNYSLTEMIFLDSRTNHVTFFFYLDKVTASACMWRPDIECVIIYL